MTSVREVLGAVLEEPLVSEADGFDGLVRDAPTETLRLSAEQCGTPQYFLDIEHLRSGASNFLETMRREIPHCACFYAFKCNDLPMLVRALRAEGYGADVAGLFELQLALRTGFDKIVFSSPGKNTEELRLAVKNRDRVVIIVDNINELEALRELVAGSKFRTKVRLGFRLRPDSVGGAIRPWSKFGLSFDELGEAIRMVEHTRSLVWSGLHIHTSWNKTPQRYVESIQQVASFLSALPPERLRTFSFVDLGGGFYPPDQGTLLKSEDKGTLLELVARRLHSTAELDDGDFDPNGFRITRVAPVADFAKRIGEAVQRMLLPLNPNLEVYLEPGRYIATASTTILLTVVAVKNECVIVDGGINMLGDCKFAEYAFSPIVNVTRPNGALRRRVIYGPLCDPHDLWGYSHYGDDLARGDVVAVLHQGAYTFSTAWRFIKAVPQYVTRAEGRFVVAKKAETFRDRYAGCRY